MKITKVEKQSKRDRYNVYLDGSFSFAVGPSLIRDFSLDEGKELSGSEVEKIKNSDKASKAYNRAVLILSYRANTENELRKKLLKNFDETAVENAIVKLKDQGFIDDISFAERYVEQSKKGGKLLGLELLRKGIDKDIVERAVQGRSQETELENALKLAEKIFAKHQKEPRQVIKQKIYERLTRRGFSYDIYKAVIDDLGI